MKYKPLRDRCCQNEKCQVYSKFGKGNIIRHSMYKTRQGRRRRYLCKTCKKTFCSTKGTPYYRLHKPRSFFDEVVQMTVEGVGISSISRIKCFSWNTIANWQYLACQAASKFNNCKLKGVQLIELQADEIWTFAGTEKKPMWIFLAIEVWSRLWISKVVGNRNYRSVKTLLTQVIDACRIVNLFIFTTDGFEPYFWAAKRLLDSICLYAQVIKKRRKDRVIKVERRLIIGTKSKMEQLLFESEDSSTINTSFIERFNLTIRQGCAYLGRRTACHSRHKAMLADNLALQMCYYNFVRPHSALKFGTETRTPAMQAGLTKKQLSFREIFTTMTSLFWWICILLRNRIRVKERGFQLSNNS
jgi:IS1 family transposase/transposase-like protein